MPAPALLETFPGTRAWKRVASTRTPLFVCRKQSACRALPLSTCPTCAPRCRYPARPSQVAGVSLTPDAFRCLTPFTCYSVPHRTAYYDSKGHLVTQRWRIARHYAKTWFVLDLICVIPYDIITAGTMGFLSMLKVHRGTREA